MSIRKAEAKHKYPWDRIPRVFLQQPFLLISGHSGAEFMIEKERGHEGEII